MTLVFARPISGTGRPTVFPSITQDSFLALHPEVFTNANEALNIAQFEVMKLANALLQEPQKPEYEEALGSLLRLIAVSCRMFDEVYTDGLRPLALKNALRKKQLGYKDLHHIRNTLKSIETPIMEEHQQNAAFSPFKTAAEGLKEDAVYRAVRTTLASFTLIRQRPCKFDAMIEKIPVLKRSRTAIEKLPDQKSNPEAWASLIHKIFCGIFWGKTQPDIRSVLENWRDDETKPGGIRKRLDDQSAYGLLLPIEKMEIEPGGNIYNAIAEKATRNRKRKLCGRFKRRYGIATFAFIKMSHDKRCEVSDTSKRAGGEKLDPEKAERVRDRAVQIENMMPTASELRRALGEVILERVKTIPRH